MVAGVAEMTYRSFAIYNVVGAVAWVLSMTLTGYSLGNLVPDIESRIHQVVAAVIALSLLPAAPRVAAVARGREARRSARRRPAGMS